MVIRKRDEIHFEFSKVCSLAVSQGFKYHGEGKHPRNVWVSLGRRYLIIFSGKLHWFLFNLLLVFYNYPRLLSFSIRVVFRLAGLSVSTIGLLQPACPVANSKPCYFRYFTSWIKNSYKRKYSMYVICTLWSYMLKISKILNSCFVLLNSLLNSSLVSHGSRGKTFSLC